MNITEAINHLRQEQYICQLIQTLDAPVFEPSQRIYYDLLESIVSQQLSVKVATVIFNRFVSIFPDHYPHPEWVISTDIETLRSTGLSYQKAGYIQNVAKFAQLHDLENKAWHQMTDDEIIQFLTQIKGVGKWTVQMLLMFSLGRPDVFPTDDLGIQQGMARLFGLQETGKDLKNKIIELAEPWRPFRTIASRYVWRFKDMPHELIIP